MLDAIFFDLDDTLLDFTGGERIAIRQTLEQFAIAPTEEICELYHEINAAQWRRLERREATRQEILCDRFVELFAALGRTCDGAHVNDVYRDLLSRNHAYIPGAETLLEQLAPRYRLYIVSNGTSWVQARRIRESGIGRFFHKIFVSEEIGADKPSPAFFDAVFAQLPDVRRETAALVGDSLTSDIRGGRAAGLHTIWYNPHGLPANPEIPADDMIRALEELPALLENI